MIDRAKVLRRGRSRRASAQGGDAREFGPRRSSGCRDSPRRSRASSPQRQTASRRWSSHPSEPGEIEQPQADDAVSGDRRLRWPRPRAVYASAEPESRMLIALDERIDDLIVASIFGEGVELAQGRRRMTQRRAAERRSKRRSSRNSPVDSADAIEAGFAPTASVSLSFERLLTLTDAFALGRRDMPAAAARFSLPLSGGACEGLVIIPQSLLLRSARNSSANPRPKTASADRRWSNSMESRTQTDPPAGHGDPGRAHDEPRRRGEFPNRRGPVPAELRFRLRPARMRRARHVSCAGLVRATDAIASKLRRRSHSPSRRPRSEPQSPSRSFLPVTKAISPWTTRPSRRTRRTRRKRSPPRRALPLAPGRPQPQRHPCRFPSPFRSYSARPRCLWRA